MRLIEAEKAKDVIHEYFKSLMVNGASGTDVDRLAVGIGSCLKHDANLLKAIDELPSVEQDTITHDSIPAETGKNDGDKTSGGCISRTQAIDTLRKMQTYKLFTGDDLLLIDQAEAQTELMMLPSAQPFYNITMTDVLKYIDDMPEDVWLEFTECLRCRGWELQWCGGDFA